MKKEMKKKWNKPVIASTLSIKKTLTLVGSNGRDGGSGATKYTS
jgi:hypothetical protein